MSDRPEFEHISSTANDTVKLLRSLDRKRERVETGLFLAEGARHAEEALANGWSPAYAFASQAALERPQTLDLLRRMERAGARVLTGTEKILVTLSRKDNPQAVITAFKQRTTTLADFPATGPRRFLALYEIRDPGNLGTVIRTADAAGCDGVILIGQTCDPVQCRSRARQHGLDLRHARSHHHIRRFQTVGDRQHRPHHRRLDARHTRP